jgi:Restriction endonuclease
MSQTIYLLKADGGREAFDSAKFIDSLVRSGADEKLAHEVLTHVQNELVNGMSTTDVYHHAFKILRTLHKPIATRYSLRRALGGLGPTGFPFEEYVAEIFKSLGYTTLIDQRALGKCVEHEIDVVAWKDDLKTGSELHMVEVKFHNELGMKSDLKTALYVKARFDDIRGNVFFYGNKQRTLTKGWLITNTKFSSRAVQYGECVGLSMIGWNYPKQGNLQDLIENAKLHPVTCLSSLPHQFLLELFKRKIVLCRDLKNDPSILKSIGLSEEEIAAVSNEVSQLF